MPSSSGIHQAIPTVERQRSTLRAAAGALAAGAIQPSLAAAVGAILLALGQVALAAVIVTPRFVAGLRPSALMNDPMDFEALATVNALRMRFAPGSTPGVVYTGDSVAIEALDDERQLAAELRDRVNREVRLEFLATHGQTLYQTVALLDQVPGHFRGVIVLSVGPEQMTTPLDRLRRWGESPEVALYSPSLREEMQRQGLTPPGQTGIYFIDFGRFFVARRAALLRRLVAPAVEPDIHYYTDHFPAWTDRQWRANLPRAGLRLATEQQGDMFALLERVVARFRGKPGVRLVLLEKPLNARLAEGYGEAYADYLETATAFAARTEVAYWRLDEDAQLTPGDYHDWAHLGNPEARRRFQQALVGRLARTLQATLAEESHP
jgi:hypothetical protein